MRVTPYERTSFTSFWLASKCLPVPWGSAAKQSNHGDHTTAANGLQLPSGSALSLGGAENVRQAGGPGGVPPFPGAASGHSFESLAAALIAPNAAP